MANKLMFAHRYAEAARAYEFSLRRHPADDGYLAAHGEAMLCLKDYAKALEDFERADSVVSQAMKRAGAGSRPYLDNIGTVLWLLRRRDEAMATFKTGAEGIMDGSIQFGDNAGGASHGLLLWYAGVSASNRSATKYAKQYLARLADGTRTKFWPGPLTLMVLGRKPVKEVLTGICGTDELDEAIKQLGTDLLKRRRLVRWVFYCATLERAQGREEECLATMRRCANIVNPILELEWYLARGEAAPD